MSKAVSFSSKLVHSVSQWTISPTICNFQTKPINEFCSSFQNKTKQKQWWILPLTLFQWFGYIMFFHHHLSRRILRQDPVSCQSCRWPEQSSDRHLFLKWTHHTELVNWPRNLLVIESYGKVWSGRRYLKGCGWNFLSHVWVIINWKWRDKDKTRWGFCFLFSFWVALNMKKWIIKSNRSFEMTQICRVQLAMPRIGCRFIVS